MYLSHLRHSDTFLAIIVVTQTMTFGHFMINFSKISIFRAPKSRFMVRDGNVGVQVQVLRLFNVSDHSAPPQLKYCAHWSSKTSIFRQKGPKNEHFSTFLTSSVAIYGHTPAYGIPKCSTRFVLAIHHLNWAQTQKTKFSFIKNIDFLHFWTIFDPTMLPSNFWTPPLFGRLTQNQGWQVVT